MILWKQIPPGGSHTGIPETQLAYLLTYLLNKEQFSIVEMWKLNTVMSHLHNPRMSFPTNLSA